MISEKSQIFNLLRKLFYSLTAALFFVLAVTGFIPVIFGIHLTGVLLIIHVTVAPFFVLSLMFTILLWAHHKQFDIRDFEYVFGNNPTNRLGVQKNLLWQKVGFWSFLVFSIPAILSIILGMYPLFGTDGQENLLDVHRYSVLILMFISGFYLILKIRTARQE
jgi:hypothetical protein